MLRAAENACDPEQAVAALVESLASAESQGRNSSEAMGMRRASRPSFLLPGRCAAQTKRAAHQIAGKGLAQAGACLVYLGEGLQAPLPQCQHGGIATARSIALPRLGVSSPGALRWRIQKPSSQVVSTAGTRSMR